MADGEHLFCTGCGAIVSPPWRDAHFTEAGMCRLRRPWLRLWLLFLTAGYLLLAWRAWL